MEKLEQAYLEALSAVIKTPEEFARHRNLIREHLLQTGADAMLTEEQRAAAQKKAAEPKDETPQPQSLQTLRQSFQEQRKAKHAEYLQEAQPICKRYGLDAEQDSEKVHALIKAFKRLEECRGCNGLDCNHHGIREYETVTISPEGEVTNVPCLVRVRKKVEKVLPRRYADKTFEDYEITDDNRKAVGFAYWFLSKGDGRGLYYYGGYGTGKTFLASLIAKESILRGRRVIFGDVPTLLDNIKRTFNDPSISSQKVLERYIACDVLIMDDVGTGLISEWNIGIIYQIINERYNEQKPIIFTSNFSPAELESRFAAKDPVSAGRIASRLKGMCVVASLGNVDRRGK